MHFQEIITTIFEPSLLKIGASIIIALSFLFGDLHSQALIAILMLMVFDTILGVMATLHENQPITSRKFSRIVQKGAVYFIAISAGFYADTTINFNLIQSTMIGFIGITEFISILENMGRLGHQTPKKLLNQLKDFQSKK